MARADTAAHMEARHNAHLCDTREPEPSSYRELHEAYGRPHTRVGDSKISPSMVTSRGRAAISANTTPGHVTATARGAIAP